MTRKRLSILSVVCVVVLILTAVPFMGACAPKETIKVGEPGYVTGALGPWWTGTATGGVVAVAIINEDPPLGRPLELVAIDTESSPEGAVKAAEYLGGMGVAFSAGYSSEGCWSALPVIERYGTPTFTAGGTSRLDKTSAGKNRLLFRVTSSDTIRSAMDGAYWERELAPLGYNKIATMSATDEASLSSTESAEKALRSLGAQMVYNIEFPPEQTTFSRVLADVFATEPNVVFLGAGVEQGSIVLKEWWDSALNKDIFWMVPEEWNVAAALEAVIPAEGSLDNRMLTADSAIGEVIAEWRGAAWNTWLSNFEKVYGAGTEPEHIYAAYQYDQVVIGALAIVAAGEATPEAVSAHVIEVSNPPGVKVYSYAEGKKALEEGKEIDYEGASTDANFDEYGQTYVPMAIFMVVDGKWQQWMVFDPAWQAEFIARIG